MNPLTILFGAGPPRVACSDPGCLRSVIPSGVPFTSDYDGNLRLNWEALRALIVAENPGWAVGVMRPSLLAVLPDSAPLPSGIPVCFCPDHRPKR